MAMDILNTIQTQAKAVTAPGSTLWERPATVQEIKVLLEDSSDSKVLDGLRKLMAVRFESTLSDQDALNFCFPSALPSSRRVFLLCNYASIFFFYPQ